MGGNAWLRQRGLWGPAAAFLLAYALLWGVHEDHPELFQGPVGRAIPWVGVAAPTAPHHGSKPKAAPAAPARSVPPGGATKQDIPAAYLAAYRHAAGECPGLSWTVLAAIGEHESNHGRGWPPAWQDTPGIARGTENYAGAGGPMQFIPGTWARWGRGGDRWDYRDAIPAAARKLCADGAPRDLHAALFAYNHDEAYVAGVLATARQYRGSR